MCAEFIDIFSPKGRTIATATLNNLCGVLDTVGSEDCEEQGTPPPATCLACRSAFRCSGPRSLRGKASLGDLVGRGF